MTNILLLIVLGACAVLAIVVSQYFKLWLRAAVTGTRISMLQLVLMSLRKVDPQVIVQCKSMAVQAGLADIPTKAMEAQFLAGGNIERVTMALIAAHRSGIELDWNAAAAIDLSGRDILEAVRVSVTPKVIFCPAGGGEATIAGVSHDGIQLNVRARVTVRTNMNQLIGGATEATVIARVAQGIVSAIGSCNSYKEVLQDPQVISRNVLQRGLDSQTAFSIISIDIADIDVGVNVGARLMVDQAEAQIRVARAEAEKRRSMAVALTQEMQALAREHAATVILAEAEIPKVIAEAYRSGQLRIQKPTSTGDSKTAPARLIDNRLGMNPRLN